MMQSANWAFAKLRCAADSDGRMPIWSTLRICNRSCPDH